MIKLNEDISTLLEANLQEKFKGEDIIIKVCREYKADCEAEIGEDYEEKCCKTPEEQTVLENTFEAALTIGGILPNIGSITEENIKEILETKNITGKDESYKSRFDNIDKRFKFLGEFEINPNSLFEIGFCDPPIEIGQGPLAGMKCSILGGQQVQLGPGGTVGVSREGSPYCNVFNAFNKLDIVRGMQKYCESRTQRM